jgi:hypothetical protein
MEHFMKLLGTPMIITQKVYFSWLMQVYVGLIIHFLRFKILGAPANF